jgi:hypothetical protein
MQPIGIGAKRRRYAELAFSRARMERRTVNWSLLRGFGKAGAVDTVPAAQPAATQFRPPAMSEPDPWDEIIASAKSPQVGRADTNGQNGGGGVIVVDLGSRRNMGRAWTDYLKT